MKRLAFVLAAALFALTACTPAAETATAAEPATTPETTTEPTSKPAAAAPNATVFNFIKNPPYPPAATSGTPASVPILPKNDRVFNFGNLHDTRQRLSIKTARLPEQAGQGPQI